MTAVVDVVDVLVHGAIAFAAAFVAAALVVRRRRRAPVHGDVVVQPALQPCITGGRSRHHFFPAALVLERGAEATYCLYCPRCGAIVRPLAHTEPRP